MLKSIFTFCLIVFSFSQLTFAQTKPGQHEINQEPLTWHIDLYQELKTQVPAIESKTVYYIKVTNNQMFPDTRNYKFGTTDSTITVTRGKDQGTFKLSGELAKKGDRVELAYNQKLYVYVPFAEKVFSIAAQRGKKVVCIPEEASAAGTNLKAVVDKNAEFEFKRKKSKSSEPAKESVDDASETNGNGRQ